MSGVMQRGARPLWWVLAALVIVALNLRPILAATGPLLDTIQHATGLSDAQAGWMTTLPIFVMGACALAAGALQRFLGGRVGITLGVLVIAAACAWRVVMPSANALVLSAAVSGVGIALVQALMPGVIKGQFGARAGMAMGLYSTGIMGGAAFAAALTPTLAERTGWAASHALWALPALVAAAIWWKTCTPAAQHAAVDTAPTAPPHAPMWRSPRAWLLMAFFGVGTGAYTLVLAWLAPYYLELGWSSTQSGFLLAAISVGEVTSGLLVSLCIDRFVDRRWLVMGVLGLLAAALVALLLAPVSWVAFITVALAVGIGALFPLSLIITLDHARTPAQAGALLGFVQGGGYMLSSVMPLIAGALRAGGSGLQQAWVIMLGGCVLLAAMAACFRPGRTL